MHTSGFQKLGKKKEKLKEIRILLSIENMKYNIRKYDENIRNYRTCILKRLI